jgi:hypothetical protein
MVISRLAEACGVNAVSNPPRSVITQKSFSRIVFLGAGVAAVEKSWLIACVTQRKDRTLVAENRLRICYPVRGLVSGSCFRLPAVTDHKKGIGVGGKIPYSSFGRCWGDNLLTTPRD